MSKFVPRERKQRMKPKLKPKYLEAEPGGQRESWLVSYTDFVTILLILFVAIAAQGLHPAVPPRPPRRQSWTRRQRNLRLSNNVPQPVTSAAATVAAHRPIHTRLGPAPMKSYVRKDWIRIWRSAGW